MSGEAVRGALSSGTRPVAGRRRADASAAAAGRGRPREHAQAERVHHAVEARVQEVQRGDAAFAAGAQGRARTTHSAATPSVPRSRHEGAPATLHARGECQGR